VKLNTILQLQIGETMKQCEIRFWFEHGGICLWAVNEVAKRMYGYDISNNELPISQELIDKLDLLEDVYSGYLNWDYPPDPSPWTKEQKKEFILNCNEVYERLCAELGSEYIVINDIMDCVS